MRVLSADERRDVLRLLWPQHVDCAEPHADTLRWHQQGFELQALDAAFPLGLVQGHGGPCGVLAAVQAEILRLFLFEYHEVQRRVARSSSGGESDDDAAIDTLATLQELLATVQQAGEGGQRALLTEALAAVLVRCSNRQSSGAAQQQHAVHVVVLDSAATGDAAAEPVYHEQVVRVADHRDPALLRVLHDRLSAFESPHGVMNFVFSAIRTKGVAAIRSEMDDPDAAFTAQFGHCSQELLNFLLTGSAVSNVFDGSVPMGDTGLMLHGIPKRPQVGYLTQLEALRYCQVGSYYKSPMYPVWVIGSTSHFSVCFSLDMSVSDESTSQLLFQRVQRVFKSFDTMESGFMDIAVLAESLKQLGVSPEILSNEYWMARLLAQLEVAGAGIVLWDEYWKTISVLLHTGDFELALRGDYQSRVHQQDGSGQSPAPRPRSDSDLARELQAQFDSESSGGASSTPLRSSAGSTDASSQSASAASSQPADESFDLFYYNGLGSAGPTGRRPQLAQARVTVPKKIDFVGASVPIFETGTGGGYGASPLEEIVKTKWPSARIDWQGQSAPSID